MLNQRDDNGWQPLHEAVRSGQVETVKFLLENGGNVNSLTDGEESPLHIAREFLPEDHELTSFLIGLGALDVGAELDDEDNDFNRDMEDIDPEWDRDDENFRDWDSVRKCLIHGVFVFVLLANAHFRIPILTKQQGVETCKLC